LDLRRKRQTLRSRRSEAARQERRTRSGEAITARATKVALQSLEGADLERGVDKRRMLIYLDHPEAYEVDWRGPNSGPGATAGISQLSGARRS
jgi:hypothetical protein